MKIKISLRQNVEKSISRKRYFYLFVCLGVFISVIKLPRIPIYLLNPISLRLPFSTIKILSMTSSSNAFVFGSFFVFIFLIPFFLLFFCTFLICRNLGIRKTQFGMLLQEWRQLRIHVFYFLFFLSYLFGNYYQRACDNSRFALVTSTILITCRIGSLPD